MKIAIVGPSPVPFVVGGVENLLWGMLEYINQNTEHSCELIKLPSREDNFWNIINTYKQFWNVDLSYFDMVISTKYPAWMVNHPNHICYLQHRLRGLYDTYHFTNLPIEVECNHPAVRKILNYVDTTYENPNLDTFFRYMDELYEKRFDIPQDVFGFPHPFIRKLVHYMDNAGLSNNKIKRFYCISDTVKKRKEYFPKGCEPTAIHHPSFLKDYYCDDYKYLFTVSRLDGPKRVAMMVEAMKYVDSDIELIIAGKGPEEERLKAMAKDDKRIKFVGFVNDDEVKRYYAGALAVLYVPYEEDFGLVTVEAMRSKKTVITCNDSGGTNEFVMHKKSGLVASPNPKSLAQQISYVCTHREEAREMGQYGYQLVKDITWERTVSTLLESIKESRKSEDKCISKRKKITVTSHFAIYPPRGGGQSRVFNLYRNLAKDYDIEIVSMTGHNEGGSYKEISNNLMEIVIPKTSTQAEKEWEYEKEVGVPVSDTALPLVSHLTPKYGEALEKSMETSDYVILSHPFLLHEVEKYRKNQMLIYEAQDVEFQMKSNVYKNKNKKTRELLDLVYRIEKETCEKCGFIMTCSDEDRLTLNKLYNIPENKFLTVPNGVDCQEIDYINPNQRREYKSQLGLAEEHLAVFVGSWHPPNIEACEHIIKLAETQPKVKFLIVGSVCNAILGYQRPGNIGLMGVISDDEKKMLYRIADVALNPMCSGSGTNLKMFDYMAAGIPVITTEFGTRGIAEKSFFSVADIDQFGETLVQVLDNYKNFTDRLNDARSYVEDKFDWHKIAKLIRNEIEKADIT